MTFKEIIDIETRKIIEDLYKIHFINEGGWWRAYEWSALLCRNFPNGLENKDKLNITHKSTDKVEDGLILVGLHLHGLFEYGVFNRSITKFIPIEKYAFSNSYL